ncbi:MAG: hypothetical protein M1825_000809 [Sarcosagium campestre]|nr:MAG: hypothetical protein M1825_000809 [Sarcosagium campestre]
MTSNDVRDIMDLPSEAHPRPAKKQKLVEKRPEGISRELFALLGERAAPVAITEHVKYKERPKWTHKARAWEMSPFTNPARNDGLILRHWRQKGDPDATRDDKGYIKAESADATQEPDPDYYYAKFDVKVEIPEYTEREYDVHLRDDDDWSKEETDYLMELCRDFDLRWIVIADRYDFHPVAGQPAEDGNETLATTPPQERAMEDLKARFYTVAAKIMEIRQSLSNMSISEYELHEKMTKYDPAHETQRKKAVEALFHRKPEEVKEEEMLIGELKRMVFHQDRIMQERKSLYARLEAQPSTGSSQIYQSSQGLNQLFQNLLTADKTKKRRSLLGPVDTTAGPAAVASGPNTAGQLTAKDAGRRESLNTAASATTKKSAPAPAVERRKLTKHEEEIYGVTHHDRLQSGVQFRHDKVTKLAQAKSHVQAQRVSAALTELEIPPRLVMPTARVSAEYERLIQAIYVLTDVRKLSEKLDGELKVALAQKAERERHERASQPAENTPAGPSADDTENKDGEDADVDKTGGDIGTGGGEDRPTGAQGDGEDSEVASNIKVAPSRDSSSRPTTAGGDRKRSASIMSDKSAKSAKSTYSTRSGNKRQRK